MPSRRSALTLPAAARVTRASAAPARWASASDPARRSSSRPPPGFADESAETTPGAPETAPGTVVGSSRTAFT
ncbi:hypothetical protein ACM9HB_30015, partial [Streptomyces sp. JAC128]|uniref:hypothetical protein n=1 Tax=Streptomyces sp. JAC128 TaxID=3418412 RepID=UPI003D813AAF